MIKIENKQDKGIFSLGSIKQELKGINGERKEELKFEDLNKEEIEKVVKFAEKITLDDIEQAQKVLDKMEKEEQMLKNRLAKSKTGTSDDEKIGVLVQRAEDIMDKVEERLEELERQKKLFKESGNGKLNLKEAVILLHQIQGGIKKLLQDSSTPSQKLAIIQGKIDRIQKDLKQL